MGEGRLMLASDAASFEEIGLADAHLDWDRRTLILRNTPGDIRAVILDNSTGESRIYVWKGSVMITAQAGDAAVRFDAGAAPHELLLTVVDTTPAGCDVRYRYPAFYDEPRHTSPPFVLRLRQDVLEAGLDEECGPLHLSARSYGLWNLTVE